MAAWSALATDAASGRAHGDWFAGPLWLAPLVETYFHDSLLRLLFVYRRGKLAGAIPFVSGGASGTSCAPGWSLPVNSHVRRIGLLARVPLPEVVIPALETVLGDVPHGNRRCVAMRQVIRGSALADALASVAGEGRFSMNTVEESTSAVVEVPDGWAAYEATRSGEQLHPLRKRRRMKKDGTWEYRAAHAEAGFDDAWEQLLHVERHSWKQAAGTSIVNEAGASAFYGAVARGHVAEGRLRLHLLTRNGVPVAHTFGVVHGRTYYLLKHSYDEAHRQFSPGFQLMWHVMQECVAEGCDRLDLLGDVMTWKAALATNFPRYASHMIFPVGNLRCQYCRFTNEVLKPAGRRLGVKKVLQAFRANGG